MENIHYVKGDATSPVAKGNKIIVHICNDMGGWGKGFVLAISKKWKKPEIGYKNWHMSGENFVLGAMQLVQVEEDVWIANMIGQEGIYKNKKGEPPIRYQATESALQKVAMEAIKLDASVHMPRIGCGLAGGSWDKIEPLILHHLTSKGIEVTVYDY